MSYYHNIAELLIESVKKHENLNAFSYKQNGKIVYISYKNFLQDVYRAIAYIENICSNDKHIALAGRNSYSWIVLFYAITISGRVVVLPNTSLYKDEFCEELNMADVSCLFCDESVYSKVENQLIRYESINSWTTYKENAKQTYNIDNNQPAAILFTTGTTAKPKPVLLSHENLSSNASCTDLGFPEVGNCMSILPNYHVYPLVINVLWPIVGGFCNFFCAKDEDYLHDLKSNNIMFTCCVAAMLKPFAKMLKLYDKNDGAAKVFGASLKCIALGGVYVNPYYNELFDEYDISLRVGYGLTETSSAVAMNTFDINKSGSVGKIQSIFDVKIKDNEIYVRGKGIMLGYYKMPKETEESFENGWFKTGDIGYIDSEDFLFITGRKKNLIIRSNGENVSPEQIEAYICSYEEIDNAHAYQKEDKIYVDVALAKSGNKDCLAQIKDEYNSIQPSHRKIYKLNCV